MVGGAVQGCCLVCYVAQCPCGCIVHVYVNTWAYAVQGFRLVRYPAQSLACVVVQLNINIVRSFQPIKAALAEERRRRDAARPKPAAGTGEAG